MNDIAMISPLAVPTTTLPAASPLAGEGQATGFADFIAQYFDLAEAAGEDAPGQPVAEMAGEMPLTIATAPGETPSGDGRAVEPEMVPVGIAARREVENAIARWTGMTADIDATPAELPVELRPVARGIQPGANQVEEVGPLPHSSTGFDRQAAPKPTMAGVAPPQMAPAPAAQDAEDIRRAPEQVARAGSAAPAIPLGNPMGVSASEAMEPVRPSPVAPRTASVPPMHNPAPEAIGTISASPQPNAANVEPAAVIQTESAGPAPMPPPSGPVREPRTTATTPISPAHGDDATVAPATLAASRDPLPAPEMTPTPRTGMGDSAAVSLTPAHPAAVDQAPPATMTFEPEWLGDSPLSSRADAAVQTGRTDPAGHMPAARPAEAHAPAIARQIAHAVTTLRSGEIELALSPEELGKLRLRVGQSGDRPVVTVWFERPDVLDAARRHLDLLLQDLADSGFDSPMLDLRHEDGQAPEDGAAGDDAPPDRNDTPAPALLPRDAPPQRLSDRPLDIRV